MREDIRVQSWNPPTGVPEETRKLKSYILEQLPELPPWVLERRFKAERNALFVSDMIDLTHRDNPHVRSGSVPKVPSYDRHGNPRPVWFEVGFPWDFAAQKFGAEACQYLRHSSWSYIIQRPTR